MKSGRKPYVFDTNVAIVANRRDGGSYACAAECAREILEMRRHGLLILDGKGLILAEYQRYLNISGQPGVGDVFLRWIFNNRGRADLCRTVEITDISHPWRRYDEFPDDDRLSNFDPSDQKFVAVSRAHGPLSQIFQAADHKWLAWEAPLQEQQVNVRYLCRAEMETTAAGKAGA